MALPRIGGQAMPMRAAQPIRMQNAQQEGGCLQCFAPHNRHEPRAFVREIPIGSRVLLDIGERTRGIHNDIIAICIDDQLGHSN
jgi:hypothetical protein